MRYIFIILTLMLATPAMADKYVCHTIKKTACQALGCKAMEVLPDDFRIINEEQRTYEIETDKISLSSSETSGAFKIFKFGATSFIKISTIDAKAVELKRGQFLEVRDIGLLTISSWGTCKF